MLELIFRGFLEWVYLLLVEIWGFIADGLLDIMSLDFAYLQSHVPIIPQMSQLLLAAGWALLLGNLVFQALKSMAAGLGFEGEDPKLLFSRTFVFAFLLLASPQICRIGLDLTSNIMALLSVPDATDVGLVDESVFGALGAAWIMAIICSVIVMFKVLGLVIEVAERYVILAMLTICAPLAFAMGGSKNTASIFTGWCRMFGSMCLLMVTNLVCCKMLFSVVSTVPSGLDVLPWMVLIFAIVKVAKKSDAIITRIGLNPAITGGPGRTLPGMLAYTVIRTAIGQAAKGIGGGAGGGRGAKAASASAGPKPGGPSGTAWSRFSSPNYGGRSADAGTAEDAHRGTGRFSGSQASGGARGAGRYSSSSQSSSQQSSANYGTAQQASARQENTSQTASTSQQTANGTSSFHSGDQTHRGAGRYQQTRRSSVPPGARRSPSYVPPAGSTVQTPGAANTQAKPGQSGVSTSRQSGPAGTTVPKGGASGASAPRPGAAGTSPAGRAAGPAQTGTSPARGGVTGGQSRSTQTNTVRPGPAGNRSRGTPPTQPKGARPGAAGTGTAASASRSTHTTAQTLGGSTVNNSTQTNVTTGKGSAGTTAPRQPHPGGTASPPKPGRVRSTKREKPGAGPKTAAAPAAAGASRPDAAGKPARSTQRPPDSTGAGRQGHAPPVSGTSPSTARPEHSTGAGRALVNGASPSPARQETRKPAAGATPARKGGAPTVRPGPAGTATAGRPAAGTKPSAEHAAKRAAPTRRPPGSRGGSRRG